MLSFELFMIEKIREHFNPRFFHIQKKIPKVSSRAQHTWQLSMLLNLPFYKI